MPWFSLPDIFRCVSGQPIPCLPGPDPRSVSHETAGKTIEEIELLFSPGGPKPGKTKPGNSRLDAEIAHVVEAKRAMSTSEFVEHVQAEKEKRASVDNV